MWQFYYKIRSLLQNASLRTTYTNLIIIKEKLANAALILVFTI